MTRYKITFTNANLECTLDSRITKAIFADSLNEAKQLCDDLYNDFNGHFRIISEVAL